MVIRNTARVDLPAFCRYYRINGTSYGSDKLWNFSVMQKWVKSVTVNLDAVEMIKVSIASLKRVNEDEAGINAQIQAGILLQESKVKSQKLSLRRSIGL